MTELFYTIDINDSELDKKLSKISNLVKITNKDFIQLEQSAKNVDLTGFDTSNQAQSLTALSLQIRLLKEVWDNLKFEDKFTKGEDGALKMTESANQLLDKYKSLITQQDEYGKGLSQLLKLETDLANQQSKEQGVIDKQHAKIVAEEKKQLAKEVSEQEKAYARQQLEDEQQIMQVRTTIWRNHFDQIEQQEKERINKATELEKQRLAAVASSIGSMKDTSINLFNLDESTYESTKTKIDEIKRYLTFLEQNKAKIDIDDKELEVTNKTIKELKDNLDRLQSSFRSKPLGDLLKIEPKSIQQANNLISEMRIRRDQLTKSDANYSTNLVSLNKRIRDLGDANQEAANQGLKLQKSVKDIGTQTQKTGLFARELVNTLKTFAGFYFARDAVKQLMDISGQFELQRVSLKTILQDATAANKIFSQLQGLAVKSPFQFLELTAGAKQLAAMGTATKDLFAMTKTITDLAAGLGVDMSRLILAVGQVQASAVLRGTELRQFTEAGIPLIQLLRDKWNELNGTMIKTGEVFDLIGTRQIPFEMVKEVLTDLTSEGGRFYDMQAIQAETLYGKLSNLRDAYDIMLDQIGQSTQNVLKGGLDSIVVLMNNWEALGRILVSVASAYGIVKAAQMFNIVAIGQENSALLQGALAAKTKSVELLKQAALYRTLTVSEQIQIATVGKLTTAELRQLAVSGQLTKDIALRMIATRQITVSQAGHLKSTLDITRAEIARAAATTRLSIVMGTLGGAIKSLGASFLALAANPFTWVFAAIAAIGYFTTKIIDNNKALSKSYEDSAKNSSEFSEKLINDYKSIAKAINDLLSKYGDKKIKLEADIDVDRFKMAIDSIFKMVENSPLMSNVLTTNIKQFYDETGNITDYVGLLQKLSENLQAIQKGSEEAALSTNIFSTALSKTNTTIAGIFDDTLTSNLDDVSTGIDILGKSILNVKTPSLRKDFLDIQKELKNTDNSFEDMIKILGKFQEKAKEKGLSSEYLNLISVIRDLSNDINTAKDDYGIFIKTISKQFPNIDWSKASAQQKAELVSMFESWMITNDGMSEYTQKWLTNTFGKTYYIKAEVEIQDLNKTELTGFRAETFKIAPKLFSEKDLQDFKTYGEFVDEIKKKQKELTQSIKEIENIKNPTEDLISNLKIYKDDLSNVNKVIERFNISIKDKGVDDANKEAISRLKEESDLIKKVYADYEKLRKSMGDTAAQEEIKKIYDGLMQPEAIPFDAATYKKQLTYIAKNLQKLDVKAATDVKLTVSDENIKELEKQIKKGLDKASRQIEQYRNKFNLFEQLLGFTGDQEMAITMSFGVEGIGEGLVDQIKQNFAAISGIEFDIVMDMPKDQFDGLKDNVKEPFLKAFDEIQKLDFSKIIDMSKLVSTYADADKKIKTINANTEKDIQDARDSTYRLYKKNAAGEIDTADSSYEHLTDLLNKFVESRRKKGQEEINAVNEVFFQSTELYKKLFGDLSTESLKSLKKLLADSEDFQSKFKPEKIGDKNFMTATIDNKQLKLTEEQWNKLSKAIAKLSADIKKDNPFAELFNPSGESLEDKAKSFGEALDNISDKVLATLGDIQSMFSAMNNETGDKLANVTGDIMGYFEGITTAGKGVSKVMTGDITGVFDIVSGVAKFIGTVFSATARRNKRIIKNSEAEIKRLENTYNDLGKAVEKAWGQAKYNDIRNQQKNLVKQNEELQKQLSTTGKKGGLSDEEAEEIQRQIKENADTIKYLVDQAFSDIGIDVKSITDQLSDAMFDAFANGTDAAEAWGAAVDNIINDIVKNMITQMFLYDRIKPLVEKLKKDATDKNGALNLNKLSTLLPSFKEDLITVGDDWLKILELAKQYGFEFEDLAKEQAGKGTAQTIQGVTEDTANILGGYMNGMRAEMVIQTNIFNTHTAIFTNIYNLLQQRLITTDNPIIQAQLGVMNQQLEEIKAIKLILSNTLGAAYDAAKRSIRVT